MPDTTPLQVLQQAILNLPCEKKQASDNGDLAASYRAGYGNGHRDARHAAAELVAGLPAAAPTDEQIDAAVEAYLPVAGDELRKVLTFTRWKDGIDCDYVNHRAREFVRAMLAALASPAPAAAPTQQPTVEHVETALKAFSTWSDTATKRDRMRWALEAYSAALASPAPAAAPEQKGQALDDEQLAEALRAPGTMTWGQCRNLVDELRKQGIVAYQEQPPCA